MLPSTPPARLVPLSPLPLSGWHIISLRPQGQHDGVRKAATKLGAALFALSLSRLEELTAHYALADALACTRVIVTSPAAVRFARKQLNLTSQRNQSWFAVGPSTAMALRQCGLTRIETSQQGADSEALLALDSLHRLQGQRVGIITAPGGRKLIAETLRERGALLQIAEVYHRVPVTPRSNRLRALNALPETSALLLSSAEALNALWQKLEASSRTRLVQRLCVTSSTRLEAYARALGFSTVIRSDDARPVTLLSALEEHVISHRLR